jgi:hypothetical protein
MRALFETVFGHAMDTAHWHWKYGQGLGHGVALFEGDDMVAHYGGLTRELRVLGRPMRGCQVCDVMVLPRARRSLSRQGPMYRMAATFLETQIGWGLPHAVGFGFPSARHQGAADRMRLYEGVDRIVQLSWPSPGAAAASDVVVEDLHGLQDLGARQARRVDRLWRTMASDLQQSVLGVRDSQWLRWRYLERPGVQYELLLARSRWLRRPLGVLVLRRRDDALELLDLVAPTRQFSVLLALARRRAAAAGLPLLRCWISASHQALLERAAPGAQTLELGIEVPACRHTAGPEPALLRDRWFLMGGDADFT